VDVEQDYWESRPDPSDEEIAQVCRAWISYEQRTEGTVIPDEDDPDWWAVEAVMDSEHNPHCQMTQWRLILCLCSTVGSDDESTIGMIGAGPLETMIFSDGERAMDLIEPAADEHRNLLSALTHVWCFEEPVRPRIDRYLASRGLEGS
jgi:hypothetical protein